MHLARYIVTHCAHMWSLSCLLMLHAGFQAVQCAWGVLKVLAQCSSIAMPPKPLKRRGIYKRSAAENVRNWGADYDSNSDAGLDQPADDHADELLKCLLALYAKTALSSKDLCVIAYHASLAGVKGAINDYALSPGQSGGNYQRQVDRCLGRLFTPTEMCCISVPGRTKASSDREVLNLPVVAPHECLSREITGATITKTDILKAVQSTEWGPVYDEHPFVQQRPADADPFVPLALYVDGVRFTGQASGRTDSCIGFWVFNLVTMRRHLIATLRKSQLCACGCKGWCSFDAIFRFLRWSFSACVSGKRPAVQYDGSAWPPPTVGGEDLGCRSVVVQIKADWAELCNTFGFPTWSSKHHPCLCCSASKESMLDFKNVDATSGWLPRTDDDYEAACRTCEIKIRVASESDRLDLYRVGGLSYVWPRWSDARQCNSLSRAPARRPRRAQRTVA